MWLSELVPASDPKGITGIMSVCVCAREKEEICVSSVRSCGGGNGSCEGR